MRIALLACFIVSLKRGGVGRRKWVWRLGGTI